MTDSINYKFDVPKEFIIRILMTSVKMGRQWSSSLSVIYYYFIHSLFIGRKHLRSFNAFNHLNTRQIWNLNICWETCSKTLRVFLEWISSIYMLLSRLPSLLYRRLQWIYGDCFVDDELSQFCLSISIRKQSLHQLTTQIYWNTKLLSINSFR